VRPHRSLYSSSLHRPRRHHHRQQQQLNHGRPPQLHCRAADILKEIVGSAESGAAGFKQRRPLAPTGRLLTTDAYSYVAGWVQRLGGSGTGRTGDEGQREREAGVGERKSGSTWKPVDVQQRATMTETWFTRRRRQRRRRRIISPPRQYCLSCAFYSLVLPHVRSSFLWPGDADVDV